MIEKIQTAIYNYLSEFFGSHGIPIEFRYDQDVDLLKEFRRSIELRANNKQPYSELCQNYYDSKTKGLKSSDNQKYGSVLGLFNRSALRKSSLYGKNATLELKSYVNNLEALLKSKDKQAILDYMNNPSEYGEVELRYFMNCEIEYNISLLFDNVELSDLAEMLYVSDLAELSKSVKVTYNFGEGIEPLEEVPYTLNFSILNSIGKINNSNLRQMDFSLTVSGPFFSPYYNNAKLIFTVDLDSHVFSPKQPIDSSVAFKDNQPTRIYMKSFKAENHLDGIFERYENNK